MSGMVSDRPELCSVGFLQPWNRCWVDVIKQIFVPSLPSRLVCTGVLKRPGPRPKVLLVGRIEYAYEDWEKIQSACDVFEYSSGSREDFLREIKAGRFDDCIAICRSNQYTHLSGNLDAEVLNLLPKSIRYICNIGSGVNSICTESCKRRGITVSNTPSVAADGVAETVIFLIFGVLRRANVPISTARAGEWQHECPTRIGMRGKVLGLIGSGETASAVAERAVAFGMKIKYCCRGDKPPSNFLKGQEKCCFEELTQTSDIISLHVLQTPETERMLSTREFRMMKQDAIIINTARGGSLITMLY
ncbi:glyoxylate reductase [Extremus antarcticus]|uniref:Glyoxylate reductase n=1 Tax=Extremus antarcticus TaxID=702011 RepID=A0AAJ0DML3_9PEZI|nr:glyoxylate reductase [Extremus antarcticus]